MLISLCVPIMNRTRNLRTSLPALVAAANASPPVELVILDYHSPDDLQEYLEWARVNLPLAGENFWNRPRYLKGDGFYNSAHARNLAAKASHGEYLVQLNAEARPRAGFVAMLRAQIEQHHWTWLCEQRLGQFIAITRAEFEAAGGYDERFRLYAPEDKDICARLHRRGGSFYCFGQDWIEEERTPNRTKLANLDCRGLDGARGFKQQMADLMRPIYEANNATGALVANEGRAWGSFQ